MGEGSSWPLPNLYCTLLCSLRVTAASFREKEDVMGDEQPTTMHPGQRKVIASIHDSLISFGCTRRLVTVGDGRKTIQVKVYARDDAEMTSVALHVADRVRKFERGAVLRVVDHQPTE